MANETSTTSADQGTRLAETAGEAGTAATATTEEFQNIPLGMIIIEEQIRSDAGIDGEDSQGFVDSIAAKGVLEPIIVTPLEEGKFLLLAGERRCLACRKLGIETIPARVLPNVRTGEEVLTN